MTVLSHVIDGAAWDGDGPATQEVVDPSTEQVIAQVAEGSVRSDAELLRTTLEDTVQEASKVDWDLTAIASAAARGVDATKIATALGNLRNATLQQCGVDLTEPDKPKPAAADETPNQRRSEEHTSELQSH